MTVSYPFSVYETSRFKATDISLRPISPGSYIICTDSGDVFYDTEDGVRKQLTDIIDLETDAERAAILAPLDKMYFVKETAHFWRYLDGMWVDLFELASNAGAKPYVKIFTSSDWSNGRISIPAMEHKQALSEGEVLSRVFMLKDGSYSDKYLAAMDTEVSVTVDKNVVLLYDGPAYDGKVILFG